MNFNLWCESMPLLHDINRLIFLNKTVYLGPHSVLVLFLKSQYYSLKYKLNRPLVFNQLDVMIDASTTVHKNPPHK